MAPRLLFDATRFAWRSRRAAPTGIDRVLYAYSQWLILQQDFEVIPVALAGERLVRVPKSRMTPPPQALHATTDGWRQLRDVLDHEQVRPTLRRGLEATPRADWLPLGADLAARALAGLASPAPRGDLYLNVSHTGLHRDGLLAGLVRRGVKPVVLVHDLIPITHPEFCTPAAGPRHARRIGHVLDHACLVIANSQATADDLSAHARRFGRTAPPTITAHLGLSSAFEGLADAPPVRRPYFVCVGTIEARKNLAFLLTVWRRLSEMLGAAAPHLVLVGRRGWENEAVIDHLDRSPAVRALVHEVPDLSDADLATLLRGARALLAPSLAEGFDLPAVEALALGCPVIASDIPAHREVAGGARLLDPLDGPAWIAAVNDAMVAAAPRTPRPPPSWQDHFAKVGAALRGFAGGG